MKSWQYVLLAILGVCACAGLDRFIYGYRIGFENHGIQLPYIALLHDPSLFPGDRFMQTMDGYFSYFWLTMAWLTRTFPLEATFAIGHALLLALRYTGIFMLARAAFPRNRWTPFLAIWIAVWGETTLGAESFHWYYFTHTPVATAMGIWALYFGVRRLWWVAFAVAGAMFNVQAMQAGYVFLMLGAGVTLDRENWNAKSLSSPAAWFLAAAPGLFWMFRSGAVGSPGNLGELIRAFYPAHFFPSSFNIYNWLGLALTLALAGMAFWGLRKERAAQALAAMGAAILAMWLIGGILLETIEPGILIKMHLYRASSYLLIVTMVLWAGWVVDVICPRLSGAWIAAFVCGNLAMAACLGSFNFLRYTEMPTLALLIVTAVCWIAALLPMARWARLAFAWAGVAVFAVVPCLQVSVRFANDEGYFWWLGKFAEVQVWARNNTEPEDKFLTPPDMNAFRALSQRPIVFEWFDGAAILWDKSYAEYWQQWYLEAGGKFRKDYDDPVYVRLAQGWIAKPQAEIEAIARRENASYIVMRPPHPWELAEGLAKPWVGEKLYENESFFIVKTPQDSSSLAPAEESPR